MRCLGVTGNRLIPSHARPVLAAQLEALFGAFARPGWLLSPLAEGADRLAAQRALAAGWAVEALLPFPALEYEADFHAPVTPGVTPAACVEEFRALLAASARVTVLPHRHAPDPVPGYEAAGHAVVSRADLVIAIWDGEVTGRRAGTSAMVQHARRQGVPVWWLDTRGEAPPQLLLGEDLLAGDDAAQWLAALAASSRAAP